MTQAPEYRLVPVEPTEAMMDAMEACSDDWPRTTWRQAWGAAIAAAPHTAAPAADRAVSETVHDFAAQPGLEESMRQLIADQQSRTAPPADRAELAEELKNLVKGYAGEQCLPWEMVEAAIDALARSTDAPTWTQAQVDACEAWAAAMLPKIKGKPEDRSTDAPSEPVGWQSAARLTDFAVEKRAFEEGKVIQGRCGPAGQWKDTDAPGWFGDCDYRVKPAVLATPTAAATSESGERR